MKTDKLKNDAGIVQVHNNKVTGKARYGEVDNLCQN